MQFFQCPSSTPPPPAKRYHQKGGWEQLFRGIVSHMRWQILQQLFNVKEQTIADTYYKTPSPFSNLAHACKIYACARFTLPPLFVIPPPLPVVYLCQRWCCAAALVLLFRCSRFGSLYQLGSFVSKRSNLSSLKVANKKKFLQKKSFTKVNIGSAQMKKSLLERGKAGKNWEDKKTIRSENHFKLTCFVTMCQMCRVFQRRQLN